MADWTSLIDNSLAKDFDKPVYDPTKGRKAAIAMLDKVATQYESGASRGRLMFKVGSNDAVSFEPTLSGSPLLLNGESKVFVPKERFLDFVKGLKGAVAAGELDDAIKAAQSGSGPVKGSTGKSKGTRTFSEESKLNIRVGGFRRGGKDDATIKAMLKAEGVSDAAIAKALARKK